MTIHGDGVRGGKTLPLGLAVCAGGLLLTLGLSACALPGLGGGSSGGQTKYAAPDPIDIKVQTDDKLASSAVISSAGGSVSALGADGTKFTLTLPKGAVQGSEKITLIPVSAADGLPFSGGLAGAVQMAPEGLRLLAPAVLRIESPKVVAAKGFETVAFAYHENGKGMYLNPGEVKDGALSIEIWHFSGGGGAQATPTEIQTQQTQHVPSSAEDAFTQRVREYIGKQRQAEMLGQETDPNFDSQMQDFLLEAYDRFVGPDLPIALKDCDKAKPIISKALQWARQVQLMLTGGESKKTAQILALSDNVIDTYEKVKKKCWSGYQATGTFGEGTFSGTIASLEKPFTLTVTAPGAETQLSFTPSGPEAGTFTIDGHAQGGAVFSGSGTYTVKDAGSTSPTLITSDAGKTAASGMTFSWGHGVPIQLVPQE
jgi:hypothetical protein